ncbi:DUF2523 family protein [Chromobacterium sp. ASV23]|uniref:DUF2523 family protein n=1 Tax=Chromobacterium sp. ASV23 TaxID=2795110 RepID=UPI0018ED9461|nr:DUF2523 family protein [Chromobacterium sp. ASV23]
MTAFFQNCINLMMAILKSIPDMLYDVAVKIFGELLNLVTFIISLIPFPQALAGGLQSFLDGLGGDILYFLGVTGFATGMSIIGAAYVFRVIRKFVTLFQW